MKRALSPMTAGWSGRLTGAVVAFILLVLAGVLYSPWHRHDPAARQACIFSPLETVHSLEAGPRIQIEPVLGVIWLPFAQTRVIPEQPHFKHHSDRAPPA